MHRALVVSFVLAILPQVAGATVGACGGNDAPGGFNNDPCRSVCTESGNELVCSLTTFCANGGAMAWAVTTFGSSTHDVSIWGSCFDPLNLIDFCCVFDDDLDAITRVELNGTPGEDEALNFVFDLDQVTEENLQAWDDDDVKGVIRGNQSGDLINGSDYAGAGYSEDLFGNDGADEINGDRGADRISGGDHDDELNGNEGDDILWGGDGEDTIEGNLGADTLCDASGYNFCAADEGNFMDGGNGEDKLWFDESENPNVPCPNIHIDPNSTAGNGDDDCGDNSNYTALELPQSCEDLITVKPSGCEGAF